MDATAKLLDRMMLRSYLQAYLVCFVSLISLYIVIDLFSNLDEFIEISGGIDTMLQMMGSFYFYRVVLIFDRICSTVVFLAAMFTMAWMQRNNELLPLLSAGISTRRVLLPVFGGALMMLCVSLANRELLMPALANRLENPADDPYGENARKVAGALEPNGILITGRDALQKEGIVQGFACTIPAKIAGAVYNISAREARYIPPSDEPESGGWLLTETTPADLPNWNHPVLKVIDPQKFFLYTERVDFELLTRSQNWYQFASTYSLFRELHKPEATRLTAMAVQLHMRLTAPILTIIMVWMGLSVVLRDQNRNVFLSAGLCVIVATVFFAAGYLCKYIGEYELLSPALASWLPVLVFGPVTLAMFDAIHT